MRHRIVLAACLLLFATPLLAQSTSQTNQAPKEDPYARAFNRADLNGDGRLTGLEGDMFNRYREQERQARLGSLPFVLDANNDGTVSKQERDDYRQLRRAYYKQLREQRRLERLAKRHRAAPRVRASSIF